MRRRRRGHSHLEARTNYHKLIQSNSESARYKQSLLDVDTKLAECEKALK